MKVNIIDNDLLSIQEARILTENAYEAQQKLATFPQEKLDEIVEAMAQAASSHAKELAVMSAEETDYGKWQDKFIKNRFACEYLPAHLRNMRCVGVIRTDQEKQIMDVGVPMGVLVSLCPATSPVSTTIYTALIAVKSGNGVLFSPHPRAQKSISRVLDILIQAAEDCGLPEGAIAYLHTVTKAGTRELMEHKWTSLIMNTGVPGMLEDAYHSGKPVIYGGTGNGPAFIERTADIRSAVRDIIASKTFDNGIVSAAEQSVVVDSCIAAEVRREFEASGAYFMTEEEAKEWLLSGNQKYQKSEKKELPPEQIDWSTYFEEDHLDTNELPAVMPEAYAFVDGSYNDNYNGRKVYGYGGIVHANGEDVYVSGHGCEEAYVVSRQIPGEVFGSLSAIEKAIELGVSHLVVFYDYAGLGHWATSGKRWKAEKPIAKAYVQKYDELSEKIKVNFYHVKAHTDIAGNEMVDKMAKREVGIL